MEKLVVLVYLSHFSNLSTVKESHRFLSLKVMASFVMQVQFVRLYNMVSLLSTIELRCAFNVLLTEANTRLTDRTEHMLSRDRKSDVAL